MYLCTYVCVGVCVCATLDRFIWSEDDDILNVICVCTYVNCICMYVCRGR